MTTTTHELTNAQFDSILSLCERDEYVFRQFVAHNDDEARRVANEQYNEGVARAYARERVAGYEPAARRLGYADGLRMIASAKFKQAQARRAA